MLKDKNILYCLLFTAAGIFFSILYFNYPIHDFGNYYFGSLFARQGINIQDIYEPFQFNLLIRSLPEMKAESFFQNYAVVPPFTLFFYWPLTFLPVFSAKFLFNIFSVSFFGFYLSRLLKHLDVRSPLVLLLPVIFIIPFRNNILFGQTYLLLSGLLMAGFISEEKNKNWVAGLCYSIIIVLKISPAILLFYLIARKNYKALIYTVIFSFMLFFSASILTGWSLMKQYLFDYLPRMSVNEINNPFATTYQSVTVLLRNLFVQDQLLNPVSPFNSPRCFLILSGLFGGIVFFFFIRQLQKTKNTFHLFSFTLMSGFLLTAYTSSYSLIFLLPLCVEIIRLNDKSLFAKLILIGLACTLPVSSFQSFPLLMRFPRLFLLLILFFMISANEKWKPSDYKWATICIAFFISCSFLFSNSTKDASAAFPDHEISLLTYDYEFSGNKLRLKVIDEQGPQEKIIMLKDSVLNQQTVDLKDNQIFFQGQLTNSKYHKRKALLLNNKAIVYLSDQGRGIGFYAMRKITLK